MTLPAPYALEHLDLPAPPNARGVPYRLAMHVYPDPGPDAPVVVIFPAMGTPARFYRPFALRLGADGIAVVVVDLRGKGDSTPNPSPADRYGYHDLAGDVGAVLDALKSRLDGRRYYLLGHSLGGQLCALHLANTAEEATTGPAGLILVAVGLPYWRLYPRRRRMAVLAFSQAIAAVTGAARVWPGWAFGGKQSRRVMIDWASMVRRGELPPIGRARVNPGLVRTPVLAVSVSADWLTPRETLDHLCDQLSGAPLNRVHLDDPVLDHFSWVRKPDAVADQVTSYIRL